MILQKLLDKMQICAHDGHAQKKVVVYTENGDKIYVPYDVFECDDRIVIKVKDL